jgi:hypothetical protein
MLCLLETHLLCVSDRQDTNKHDKAALEEPHSADKAAATGDDERPGDEEDGDDVAVKAVEKEQASEPSQLGSRSPTPPLSANTEKQNRSEDTIADHLARLAGKGEELPGMESDDGLLEGETRKDNVVAADVGGERAKKKAKVKDDTAKAKDVTESDEVPVSKGARDARRASKFVNDRRNKSCPSVVGQASFNGILVRQSVLGSLK